MVRSKESRLKNCGFYIDGCSRDPTGRISFVILPIVLPIIVIIFSLYCGHFESVKQPGCPTFSRYYLFTLIYGLLVILSIFTLARSWRDYIRSNSKQHLVYILIGTILNLIVIVATLVSPFIHSYLVNKVD